MLWQNIICTQLLSLFHPCIHEPSLQSNAFKRELKVVREQLDRANAEMQVMKANLGGGGGGGSPLGVAGSLRRQVCIRYIHCIWMPCMCIWFMI